jgi:hypothetical protein
MKTFKCTCAGNPVLFFESNQCNNCGRVVGLTDDFNQLQPFNYNQGSETYFLDNTPNVPYKKCRNFQDYQACNGMVQINILDKNGAQIDYCYSCRFNQTIPNLSIEGHVPLWLKMEVAKRRALYTLKALPIPLQNTIDDPKNGISFVFATDRDVNDHFNTHLQNRPRVLTGHNRGDITINLSEADDVARSKTRMAMGEKYRTLLGHFRHELGHYYYDMLIAHHHQNHLLFKTYFGDDGQSYENALENYYQYGAPDKWQDNFISAYAAMHPWEDWAETWAHYIHIVDTMETAHNYGWRLSQNMAGNFKANAQIESRLHEDVFFIFRPQLDPIIDAWIELSVFLNSLNRSMGLQDAYPFVITSGVRRKLTFVHYSIYNQLEKVEEVI